MRADCNVIRSKEILVTGRGRHLGSDVTWSLRWRADGAFLEEIKGRTLSFRWGHDGGADSASWEVDSCGVSHQLEYDDHESLLMCAWVRTGAWLQPDVSRRLHVAIHESSQNRGGVDGGSTSHAEGAAAVVLTIGLRGKKLQARVRVCLRTWLVVGLDMLVCGDVEVWDFSGHGDWGHGVVFPAGLVHAAAAGGKHAYATLACTAAPPSPLLQYQIPVTPLLPTDAVFDSGVPSAVQVWRASSGHLLVKPVINGREVGYMMLDTGASGFVITPEAVSQLGLTTFGELHAAGMGGKVAASFVRVATWRLGPLTLSDPLMMVMDIQGLVRGSIGPIVGIAGFDLFRRCVMELPQVVPSRLPHVSPSSSTISRTETVSSSSSSTCPVVELPQVARSPSSHTSASSSTATAGTGSTVCSSSSSRRVVMELPQVMPSTLPNASPSNVISDGVGSTCCCSSSGSNSSSSSLIGSNHGTAGSSSGGVPSSSSNSERGAVSSSGRGVGSSSSSFSSSASGPQMRTGNVGGGRSWHRRDPSAGRGVFSLHLFNPSAYPDERATKWSWFPFSMIGNLPHLPVNFLCDGGGGGGAGDDDVTGGDQGVVREGGAVSGEAGGPSLMMVDTGACGADVMLHPRAVRQLQLRASATRDDGNGFVRTVGGQGSDPVRLEHIDVPRLLVANTTFYHVKAVCINTKGMDMSQYSSGIACCDLFKHTAFVLDYARQRIGLPAG